MHAFLCEPMTRHATPHHHLRTLLHLGHHIPKNVFQSSAISFAYFLAKLKRDFLCFSLNRVIFFRLKAFHPFLVMYLRTVMLETSIYFSAGDSWQSSLLNCSISTLLSRLIFEHDWSKQTVIRFLVCLRSTLFSTTCSPNVQFC